MQTAEGVSPLLGFLQDEAQIAALSFLGIVYVLKLAWMFRFRSRRERTFAAGSERAGIALSMANVFLPWQMESTRKNGVFYTQFVVFHCGVATAIAVSFLIPYAPAALEAPGVALAATAVLALASVIGAGRIVRRATSPALRMVNTTDDFLSLGLTTVFLASAIPAIATLRADDERARIVFFALTAAFLVYVPFSKICHYLFYPFTRYFLGRTLGHRGVVARSPMRARGRT